MNAARRPCAVLILSFLAACGGGGGGSPKPTPPATHAISGTVAGAPGAAMKLSGPAEKTVTADRDGRYQFTDLADGTYAVAPSLSGYSFSPPSTEVTLDGADRTGVDFSGATTPDPTHAISGTVAGAVSVSLALTGSASATTTTGSGGHYQFAGLPDGQYTVTPSLAGYAFTPGSAPITLAGADASGVDFAASLIGTPTHTISGTAGVPGATVKLSGAMEKTVTADQSGHFQFTGLPDGTYAVAPSLSGYTFVPPSDAVTLAGADRSGENFTASAVSAPTHAISGTVSGAVGASLSLVGTSATTVAGTGGFYQFTGLPDGDYTVKPSLAGYAFTPGSAPVTLAGANRSGVSFTASPTSAPTYSISGNAGIAGAAVLLSGPVSKTTTAATDGSYQFAGLAEGTYTVIPSLSGYTFGSAVTVTLAGADRSGVSFTASAIPATHAICGDVSPMGPAVSVSVTDGTQTLPVPVNDDGSFRISGLHDGSYTVRMDISPSLVSSCTSLSLSQAVTVKNADVMDVLFSPNCNMQITGTVSPPQQDVEVDLFFSGSIRLAFTNAAGVYSFTVPTGNYELRTPWPSASGSRTLYVDVGNVTGEDFSINPAGSVILFLTPDTHSGDLGGRSGADRICSAGTPPICAGSSSVHAVISVSSSDTVALMPTNFGLPASTPVRGVNGNVLAVHGWADMFPTLDTRPYGNVGESYWTGATADGGFVSGNACNGWTSSSSSYAGQIGNSSHSDRGWIAGTLYSCSSSEAHLLCACW